MKKLHETEDRDGELIARNSIQTYRYQTPEPYQAIGVRGQPVPHYMFHRPLAYYMSLFFQSSFVLDGLKEPSFERVTESKAFDWYEIPPVIILRFRKPSKA
ncbi:hypothetical protein [Paenibacillus spongiae]|uniref:Uncharacterized protein n=1 Tax=Paenibacillus spongiae TaxID=2909671 RepID=A0ABY5S9Q0_9BACL|nr:hypothetical protein [Paenibacillus spongiae]UVI29038.1 hypothetical protein L1F29_26925 [Paenibacillus spongiae]